MTDEMGMKTHTPGPWTIIPAARSGHSIRILGGNGREFVLVGSDVANDARQAANARLIAAAPELLEALKRAEYCLTAYCATHSRKCRAGCCDAVQLARAAIAKAEGKETA